MEALCNPWLHLKLKSEADTSIVVESNRMTDVRLSNSVLILTRPSV